MTDDAIDARWARFDPRPGDLLRRYEPEVEDVRVKEVVRTNGDVGEPWAWLVTHEAGGDIPWPDCDDEWTLVARGAVPLCQRPPVPERDERSEVERLRDWHAEDKAEIARLAGRLREAREELGKAHAEAASIGLEALAELEERGRPDVAFAKGVRDERRRVLEVLRRRLVVALKERMQWAQGGNERVETIWAGVEREIRECAATLGFTPDELSAEREVGS